MLSYHGHALRSNKNHSYDTRYSAKGNHAREGNKLAEVRKKAKRRKIIFKMLVRKITITKSSYLSQGAVKEGLCHNDI